MRSSDRVYETLRTEIVDGTLPPGTVLAEVEQSERLGVSRTPLREAVTRLAADGLVRPAGGRGMVVTEVSADQIRELFEVRRALEVAAAGIAAGRRDPAPFRQLRERLAHADDLLRAGDDSRRAYYQLTDSLDAAIDAAVGNPYLVGPLRTIRTHVARVRRVSKDNPQRLRQAAEEHLMITEAILDGDSRVAALAMELHLHRSLAGILAALGEPATPAEPASFREPPARTDGAA